MLLKRGLAFTTDLFNLSLLQAVVTTALALTLTDAQRIITILMAAAFYFTFFLWAWNGQTPGSRILGLKVVHPEHPVLSFRHALLRALGVELSYLSLGFGFTLSLVRLDKRTLPDLISGTYVRQKN